MNKIILCTVSGLLVGGCSRSAHWSQAEWSGGSSAPPRPVALSQSPTQVSMGPTKIEFNHQEVAGVPLIGTFIKTLRLNGVPVWAKSQFLSLGNLPSARVVKSELEQKSTALARGATLQKTLGCHFMGEARPQLRWRGSWKLVWVRNCEHLGGVTFEVVISARGQFLTQSRLSTGFTMEEAGVNIYPRGPKVSQLHHVHLAVSSLPGFLNSPAVEVSSDEGLNFSSLSELPLVLPSDDRFDMLQAYFYSNNAMNWIKDHLKFQMGGLKIRTQVGFPVKSNAAFYFANQVWLGSGDEITYSHIPWDPTIVIHESMHGVIDALTQLPLGAGEGGSLQEAFADTLTALQLDTPDMGQAAFKGGPYQRTLENTAKLSDKNGGLYHDSLILSGALWEIRRKASLAEAERITAFLLARMVPTSDFAAVRVQFQEFLKENPDQKVVQDILSERGWL